MEINKALNPVGSVSHGADGLGLAHPSSSHFHFRQRPERFCISHPAKVREVARLNVLLSLRDLANGEGSRLSPLSMEQRDIHSIRASDELLWG